MSWDGSPQMLQVRMAVPAAAIISAPPFWPQAGGPASRGNPVLLDRPLEIPAPSAPQDPGRTGAAGPDLRCSLPARSASDSPAQDSGTCERLRQPNSQWI